MNDAIALEGAVMLGSRLKRLAERLQAGAERMARDCGLPTLPAQMPLLAALWRGGPLGVCDAAERIGVSQPAITRLAAQLEALGLVETLPDGADRRQRRLALTEQGRAAMDLAETALWPRLRAAVEETCDIRALLAEVSAIETALARRPLDQRPGPGFAIRPYTDALAPSFARINRQWIEAMYVLEPLDEAQLSDPRGQILVGGGDILFVEDPELGVVGTCGLLKTGEDEFELIKMAVLPEARGRGAGEFLLRAAIARAYALGARKLFLLTNSKSAAAIRMYERSGFVHDAEILARCGGEYARCDVAMRHVPD